MSRSQLNNLLIGVSLIATGIFYLIYNMKIIPEPTARTWVFIFAGASLYFFICYFLTGIQNFGWLFPAFISAGVAGTIWLSGTAANSELVAVPVLAGVGLPFLAIFLLDRKNWWALIPAYVMAAVVGIVLMAERLPSEFIAMFVLWAIALPFLVIYLVNRQHWWALIPAGVLAVIGLVPFLSTQVKDEAMGGLVLFLIALPFFAAYFFSVRNWWALIPAGILTSIGLSIFLLGVISDGLDDAAVMNGVMYLGWGVTFGVLWLRRKVQPTNWAIYPAVGFAAAGVVAFLTRSDFGQFWPFLLIVLGLFILIRGMVGRK